MEIPPSMFNVFLLPSHRRAMSLCRVNAGQGRAQAAGGRVSAVHLHLYPGHAQQLLQAVGREDSWWVGLWSVSYSKRIHSKINFIFENMVLLNHFLLLSVYLALYLSKQQKEKWLFFCYNMTRKETYFFMYVKLYQSCN